MTPLSARAPGAPLLHPVALASLFCLLTNDHVLKRVYPGVLSGKLSDFSGLVLLPLFLQALYELAHARLRGRAAPAVSANRALTGAVLASGLLFAGAELCGPLDALYRFGLGALQWPFQALASCLRGAPLPSWRAVSATPDVSDLCALPMLLVALWLGRVPGANASGAPAAPTRARSVRALSALAITLALLTLSSPANARSAERTHDGFYLRLKFTPGVVFIDSNASISNGFQQSIASSARGLASPAGALELGGTLPGSGLVLGGRIGLAEVDAPRISTRGDHFRIQGFALSVLDLQLIARLFPEPRRGYWFGASFGGLSIDPHGQYSGELQRGYCGALEVGNSLWLGRQWSLGLDASLLVGRAFGDDLGASTLFFPSLGASVTLH